MELWRKEETNAGLLHAALHGDDVRVQTHAERLEDVRRTNRRGCRAIAVLGDVHPASGDRESRHGRDVHGVQLIAPGATRSMASGPTEKVVADAIIASIETGHLVGGLALGRECGQKNSR